MLRQALIDSGSADSHNNSCATLFETVVPTARVAVSEYLFLGFVVRTDAAGTQRFLVDLAARASSRARDYRARLLQAKPGLCQRRDRHAARAARDFAAVPFRAFDHDRHLAKDLTIGEGLRKAGKG